MDINQEILSNIVVHMKYARYLPEKNRREIWPEICDRYEDMMLDKYPHLTTEIIKNMQWVRQKKYSLRCVLCNLPVRL